MMLTWVFYQHYAYLTKVVQYNIANQIDTNEYPEINCHVLCVVTEVKILITIRPILSRAIGTCSVRKIDRRFRSDWNFLKYALCLTERAAIRPEVRYRRV